MDDDHALAERDDVVHVVAGEQDRRPSAPVVLGDKTPDAHLHADVEPDRRLVQKRHARRVDQTRRELDFHAFAEREVAHRFVNELLKLEKLGELVHGGAELLLRDAVDLLKHAEAVGGRNVPHQLGPVAHEQGHALEIGVLTSPGHVFEDARLARRGVEQAREHLERRGLPRPVRAEKTDHLASVDAECDARDRVHIFAVAFHK